MPRNYVVHGYEKLPRRDAKMPPLVPKGPNVPVELLEAHASGKLVVFAGAGVSVPAGLPNFPELVSDIYDHLNLEMDPAEDSLFRRGELDRVLTKLEARAGTAMRREVQRLLRAEPDTDVRMHKWIIDIATNSRNELRLVTTNFDRLFLLAAGEGMNVRVGPALPVPRAHHWTGLIHLHGLLPEDESASADLILTSGDFGRAYLLDAWASRFIVELVRNFSLLFVGYSVNDPVLRYLMDALAAERQLDPAKFKRAFAFAALGGRQREREKATREWSARSVETIFYKPGYGHRSLARTMEAWAQLSRGGLRTRRSWALRHADFAPSSAAEDEARLVVWALAEDSGAVARAFYEKSKPPSIGWLRIFEESTELEVGQKLLQLPDRERNDPTTLGAPVAAAAHGGGLAVELALPTAWLSRWLARHIAEPELLKWTLSKGEGVLLHPTFRSAIQDVLNKGGAPEPFRRIWSVLCSESYSTPASRSSQWFDYRDLLNGRSRGPRALDILGALRPWPILRFRSPSDLIFTLDSGHDYANIKSAADLVEVKIDLAGGRPAALMLERLTSEGVFREFIGAHAHECCRLLEDAYLWLSYLDSVTDHSDYSYIHLSSVAPESPRGRPDAWWYLVDLNRIAFEVLDAQQPAAARQLVERWRRAGFPVFQRLFLHAATVGVSISPEAGVQLLLDSASVLWNVETEGEAMSFLESAAGRLEESSQRSLERAITAGPPRELLLDGLPLEVVEEHCDRLIWRRLVTLSQGGNLVTKHGSELLTGLGHKYKQSRPAEEGEDLGSGRGEVAGDSADESWRRLIREQPMAALRSLLRLARASKWDGSRWWVLLQEFGPGGWPAQRARMSFGAVATLLMRMPEAVFSELLGPISSWLRDSARAIPEECESSFFLLVKRATDLTEPAEARADTDPVSLALDRPLGELTSALLNRLWTTKRSPGEGLPEPFAGGFERLLARESEEQPLASTILCSQLLSLYILDTSWTEKFVLPSMIHSETYDPASCWRGFLSQPRFNADLAAVIKDDLVKLIARRDVDLERYGERAIEVLVLMALDLPSLFPRSILRGLWNEVGASDLSVAMGMLARVVRDRDAPADTWRELVEPWLRSNWPADCEARTSAVSEQLAEAMIAADEAFPEAVATWGSRAGRVEGSSHRLDHLLKGEHFGSRFPEPTLALLDRVVPDEIELGSWPDLREVLDEINSARPGLATDARYRRLDEILLHQGR